MRSVLVSHKQSTNKQVTYLELVAMCYKGNNLFRHLIKQQFLFLVCLTAQRVYKSGGPLPSISVPTSVMPRVVNQARDREFAALRAVIPGEPQVDYPVFSFIPKTRFKCTDKVDGGYYADTEAQCQVFHICSHMGQGRAQRYSFLCPNGTMFQQQFNVCQWWYYVDCQESPEYYPQKEIEKEPSNGRLLDENEFKEREAFRETQQVGEKRNTNRFGSRRSESRSRGRVSSNQKRNRKPSPKRRVRQMSINRRASSRNRVNRRQKSPKSIPMKTSSFDENEKTIRELEEEILEALSYFV